MEMQPADIYYSEVGKNLFEIKELLQQKVKENSHYERLINLIEVGLEKIKKKLMNGFFCF